MYPFESTKETSLTKNLVAISEVSFLMNRPAGKKWKKLQNQILRQQHLIGRQFYLLRAFWELWWLGMIILKSLISPKEAIFRREKCLWPTAFLAYASMDVMWNSLASNPVARCHIWHCLWIEDNDAKQIHSALKLTGFFQFFSEPLEKSPIHKVRKIRCPFLFKAKSGFQRFRLLFCHQPRQKHDRANSNLGGNKLWKNLIEILFAVEFFFPLL